MARKQFFNQSLEMLEKNPNEIETTSATQNTVICLNKSRSRFFRPFTIRHSPLGTRLG